ncbi:MAG: transcription antitermination factor NusB [Gemmatimonadota bacterium]
MDRSVGLKPRFAAWRVLHDVRHGVPFDVALNRAVSDLEPADRRLAHEMAAGVYRHRSTLDQRIEPAIERGLASVRADALDILRIGVFQLTHLDRVPPHAAVQTSVDLARRLGGRRVAGFVNAVLRRLTQGGTERPQPALEASLADQHSHPAWLVDRWIKRFGHEGTVQLLQWNNRRPSLVIQPARASLDKIAKDLSAAEIATTAAKFDAGLVVETRNIRGLPGFAAGAFVVQDPAQAMVMRFADLPENCFVYDACAAPGGKSIAASQQARFVLAADHRRTRVTRLAESLHRAAPGPTGVVVADLLHPPIRAADVVLVDAPCLGTGTFARNPDARWRVTPEALATLAEQGTRFLEAAQSVVGPGGLLLFATCSLEPEENETQIEAFLARHPEFRRESSAAVPSELLSARGDLMILPHRHHMDGAYAARLRRRSSGTRTP